MKKYGLALLVLIACVFTSMISESAAIYTHSDVYQFTLEFIKHPIIDGEFFKYELAGNKICDYNKATSNDEIPGSDARKCEQGSALYDKDKNIIELSQDAGFFKNYEDKNATYLVNGSFTYDHTQPPKNFGMYFNGSYNQFNNVDYFLMMQSNGYVLLFDKDGNLVINEQGIANTLDIRDHANDKTLTSSLNPIRNLPVASKERVAQILEGTSSPVINLQVRVKREDSSKISVYVYLNGTLINTTPSDLGNDLRGYNDQGMIYDDCIIGAATYGANSWVNVTHMSQESWNGIDL